MDIGQGTLQGQHALPPDLSDYQIQAFFTFSVKERAALNQSFRESTRIAASIKLGFLRFFGAKLDSVKISPRALLKNFRGGLLCPPPRSPP